MTDPTPTPDYERAASWATVFAAELDTFYYAHATVIDANPAAREWLAGAIRLLNGIAQWCTDNQHLTAKQREALTNTSTAWEKWRLSIMLTPPAAVGDEEFMQRAAMHRAEMGARAKMAIKDSMYRNGTPPLDIEKLYPNDNGKWGS